MTDAEFASQSIINNNIIEALGHSFFAVHYADLRAHSYQLIRSTEYARKMLENSETLEEAFEAFICTLVDPKYQDKIRRFCDTATLAERIGKEKQISCEYPSTVAKGWCRISFYPVERDKDGEVIRVLFTVTGIDEVKRKELEESIENKAKLEKSQASLMAALKASNQSCFEYDPLLHRSTCFMDENLFDAPYCLEDYPESLKDMDLFHPDDVDLFIQTTHRMDDGTKQASCDVRIKKNGEYIWHTCTFNAYLDPVKERNVAILTILDISLRKATQKMYEDHLKSISAITENTLCMSIVNLTKNTYEVVSCQDSVRPFLNTTLPLQDYLLNASSALIGESAQKRFREIFDVGYLLQQVAEGNNHHEIEYLLKIREDHYEWIYSAIDLTKNPLTGEVSGAVYSRSQQIEKMNQLLLNKTLEQDYLFAAAIFVETDEFYLYNNQDSSDFQCMKNYWDIALTGAIDHCVAETEEKLKKIFVKKYILEQLEHASNYSYVYDGMIHQSLHRLEVRFSYADDAHTMLLATMRNITDASLLEKYRYDSEHDSLTNLYNRKTLFRKCRELLDAYPEEQFVMIHADIRHFRLYNTFFGEAAGDKLLCEVADIFRWMAADYEHWAYGRVDADVFCAFFPYDQEKYRQQALKAVQQLKNYRTDFMIEPVVGMYFVTDRNMPVDAMFTRATLAARNVQTRASNATRIYDETLEQKLVEEQQILQDMQAAIDEEQFKVYLQPKYSLRTNKPVGAEALVRWIHPEKGLISPGVFIPIFERNGFVTTLDRYMWKHVCQLLGRWKKEGKTLTPISVNVSRLSMFSKATVDFLKELVEKYDIEPKYLELELTESAYIDDPAEMRKQMFALQEAGFRVLLDDFGSGYSCLNTLRELPVDILKMDMKFLYMDQKDIRGGLVISSIIRMAKLLKLVVVAEGVETRGQADYLRGVGCEYVQGFLFSRPMPVADYEKILADSSKPMEHVNEATIEHIGRILAETGSGTYAMGTVIPTPLACVEYVNHQFTFVRVNPAFFTEFDTSESLRNLSDVFRERLTEHSYMDLTHAFDRSVQSGAKVRVPIMWKAADGKLQTYICSVMYEGNIGATATMVITFINVTDMFKAEEVETKQKHSIETDSKLWNYVKTLVSANDINEVTNSILQEILHYYNADRAYIFEFDWKQNIGINTYEICASGIEPMIDSLQEVPLDAMGVWIDLFNKNSLIHIKDLNALVGDESRKDEYDILAAQEIQSLIAAPVYHEKKLVGFMGVDNPKSNLDDTAFIESLAFFSVNESMREKEKADLERNSLIDPLTGVYNRAGFEQTIEAYRQIDVPIGLLLLDIDHFKALNDSYGHEYGDEALVTVAKRLMTSFRNEDKVFRMGGDEFAVLLYGCHTDAWQSLQMKFANMHQYFHAKLEKDVPVTLSVGFTQSDSGYVEGMYKLADEALYHTKNTGRAGLSQINAAHEVTYTWHDNNLPDRRNVPQREALFGTWRAEIERVLPQNKGKLFLDEKAHMIFGLPTTLTPEECYEQWKDHLAERNQELCIDTVVKMAAGEQAECIYHWNHPSKGEIAIRAAGQGHKDGAAIEVYGFMRELKQSEIVLSYEDDRFLMQAQNRLFFFTYYFDLTSRDYYIVKSLEHDQDVKSRHHNIDTVLNSFIDNYVHPDYQKELTAFADLHTLAERLKDKGYIDCEYLSISKYGWCRTRIMPMKWDENGNVTHATIMSGSINEAKKAELEKEEAARKAMQMQLRVCELVSKTSVAQVGLIDRDTGQTEIWTDAIFANKPISASFTEMKAWGRNYVYSTDADYYESNFALPRIIRELGENDGYSMSYRRVEQDGTIRSILYKFEILPMDSTKILMVIEDVSDIVPKGIEWVQQFDILEEVKEIISIFDYETYDVAYMNKMARELIGIDMAAARTKKCYEVFGCCEEPCRYCDKLVLENGSSAFMCREYKGNGQSYFIHGCTMMLNGKKYRVEQAVPASDIQSSIDQNVAKLIDEGMSSKKTLEALFNNVPGGMVMYKWDGKQLKTLRISKYYADLYGTSMVSDGENEGGPDFMRLHPDDVEEYQKAIIKALTETHYLEYVFRVWNDRINRYVWVKINAVSNPQPDGSSYVYAMYSDVTEQKDTEMKLQKSQESLLVVLSELNQICYEYDPVEHTAVCVTDENWLGLPKVFTNYPESIRDVDLFHVDDIDPFIETVHRMDHGENQTHCVVRVKKNGKYDRYSCTFHAYHDCEKDRDVAMLSAVKISDFN